jgi:hypothetical protein
MLRTFVRQPTSWQPPSRYGLAVLSGAGHLLNLDAPGKFNDAVVDFLSDGSSDGVTLREEPTNGGGHGGPAT